LRIQQTELTVSKQATKKKISVEKLMKALFSGNYVTGPDNLTQWISSQAFKWEYNTIYQAIPGFEP